MIVLFICADRCFDHVFIMTTKQWKRFANASSGKFGYREPIEAIFRFETLGM